EQGFISVMRGTFGLLVPGRVAKSAPDPSRADDLHVDVVQSYEGDRSNQEYISRDTQWLSFPDKLLAAKESILSIKGPKTVLPDWVMGLSESVTNLQRELNMEPGSLADEIWSE